ncbi:MAG: hypothetical protein KAU28_04215, partial [Phycisphaerae bacterium]|nr:hypothetical protein [Phycisphaerae bacterium]
PAPISWRRCVTADAFPDPGAYLACEESLPAWPRRLRLNVFIVAVLTSLAAAGALLVRRGAARLVLLIVIVCISAAGTWHTLRSCEILVQREQPAEPTGSLITVTCRRTAVWTHPATHLVPVYGSGRQRAEETMLIAPTGVSVRLTPGDVRLFRDNGTNRRVGK